MDSLMQKVKMNPKLASVVCLIIAAKYDELDRKIPKYDDVIRISGLILTKEALKKYEGDVLNTLDWKLKASTSMTFLQLFLTQGIIFPADKTPYTALAQSLASKAAQRAIGFSNRFLELEEVLEFAPSVVAASCVALSRKVISLEAIWPPQLQCVTGYSFNQLKKCFTMMSRNYLSLEVKNVRASESRSVLKSQSNFANRMATRSAEKRSAIIGSRKLSTRQRLSSGVNPYNNENSYIPPINKSSELLPSGMRLRKFQKRVILKGDLKVQSIAYSNPKENLGTTTNFAAPKAGNVIKKTQGLCLLKYKNFIY
eukprot:TRINITY_DN11347_c0_g1_i12.p1 TRINITY_DN11347_c0_g1~~TRINITY_DN11347_c0_g1_i12.p1  ORF type:complete len:312 (+),score=73.83 TRINITY_DN11347_c0_g1_i12:512-1447(+)